MHVINSMHGANQFTDCMYKYYGTIDGSRPARSNGSRTVNQGIVVAIV